MFYRNHVQTSCHHEARALAISCRLCQLKSDRQNENARKKDRQSDKDGEATADQSIEQNDQEKDRSTTHHYVNAKAILGHIYDSHIRIFFKCSFCPKAFVDKSAIYDHKQVLILFDLIWKL